MKLRLQHFLFRHKKRELLLCNSLILLMIRLDPDNSNKSQYD